jgi:hypothetical protein
MPCIPQQPLACQQPIGQVQGTSRQRVTRPCSLCQEQLDCIELPAPPPLHQQTGTAHTTHMSTVQCNTPDQLCCCATERPCAATRSSKCLRGYAHTQDRYCMLLMQSQQNAGNFHITLTLKCDPAHRHRRMPTAVHSYSANHPHGLQGLSLSSDRWVRHTQ